MAGEDFASSKHLVNAARQHATYVALKVVAAHHHALQLWHLRQKARNRAREPAVRDVEAAQLLQARQALWQAAVQVRWRETARQIQLAQLRKVADAGRQFAGQDVGHADRIDVDRLDVRLRGVAVHAVPSLTTRIAFEPVVLIGPQFATTLVVQIDQS